jgi:hypothetical protein
MGVRFGVSSDDDDFSFSGRFREAVCFRRNTYIGTNINIRCWAQSHEANKNKEKMIEVM